MCKECVVMVKEVSVADAKTSLSKLLEAVEEGQQIVITRHGKPVATLTQAHQSESKPVLGSASGQIEYQEGWDAPMTSAELAEFIGG